MIPTQHERNNRAAYSSPNQSNFLHLLVSKDCTVYMIQARLDNIERCLLCMHSIEIMEHMSWHIKYVNFSNKRLWWAQIAESNKHLARL